MPSYKTLTKQQIEFVATLPEDSSALKVFLDGLQNPLWIPELRRLGWFDIPPQAERDPETKGVRYPTWPVLQYLVRMAEKTPEDVFNILRGLPETDNLSIRSAVIDAALKLPAEYSAQLAESKIKSWLVQGQTSWFWHREKAVDLIEYLATSGEKKAAFSLSNTLLEIHREDPFGAVDQLSQPYHMDPEAKGLVDDSVYDKWLDRIVPALRGIDENGVIELIIGLLNSAINCSFWAEDKRFPHDNSYLWRPAIEDHSQNRERGIRNALVDAVRDMVVEICAKNPEQICPMIKRLEGEQWMVLRRIALHLLRLHWVANSALTAEHACDKANFEEEDIRHEYSALLHDVFGQLSPDQQAKILGWIDAGPETGHLTQGQSFFSGEPFTPEQVLNYVEQWKLDRLAIVSHHLEGEARQKYVHLVEKYKQPDHPDFPYYLSMSGPYSPSSPYSADELFAMNDKDLLQALREYSGNRQDPFERQRDLAMALRTSIGAHPEHFVPLLSEFRSIPKVYFYFVLGGFTGSIRDGMTVDWEPLLDFANWIVTLGEREFEGEPKEDPRCLRRDARGEVADLISKGLQHHSIPIRFREQIWPMLELLSRDGFESGSKVLMGEDWNDVFAQSLNCTPGKALHAVVQYALWIFNSFGEGVKEAFSGSLIEVQPILEEHLFQNARAHPITHAVLGQWLPWLQLMDCKWTQKNLQGILPATDDGRLYRKAAWDAYIRYNSAYDDVFELLRGEYVAAIEAMPRRVEQSKKREDYVTHLVDHVMIFYLRGLIDLKSPDDCLQRLYRKDRPDINGHVMSFIGRSLNNAKSTWRPDPLGRAKRLWTYRLTEAKKQTHNPKRTAEEMAAFGWWYSSEQLDTRWATQQLEAAVELAGFLENEFDIFERIRTVSEKEPDLGLKALTAILKYDKCGRYGYEILTTGKIVVQRALKSGLSNRSEFLVEKICEKGFVEAREWLK
ncbi:MAG TPA: hypothetical protein VGL38_01425 [bacterium]|jgi:hypothetical protein